MMNGFGGTATEAFSYDILCTRTNCTVLLQNMSGLLKNFLTKNVLLNILTSVIGLETPYVFYLNNAFRVSIYVTIHIIDLIVQVK